MFKRTTLKIDYNLEPLARSLQKTRRTKYLYVKGNLVIQITDGAGQSIINLVLKIIPKSNSIHTPRSSLYTPLNLTIDENTNLPLKLLYTPHLRLSVLMPGHVRCASSFLSSSFLSSAHPIFVPQARMAFKNSDNGAEISFETVEKEEDEVQV